MTHPEEMLALRDGRRCALRSAEPKDAPHMLRYMKTMLGETPFLLRTPEEFDYTAEEEAAILRRYRDDPRGLMLVAVSDGQIVAVASLCPQGTKSRVLHRGEVGISVRKDHWRQGIGTAQMERLIAFAVQAGYEQLELTVESKNLRALGLYAKFGFTVYGTRPHGMKYSDGSYADDYLMVKML